MDASDPIPEPSSAPATPLPPAAAKADTGTVAAAAGSPSPTRAPVGGAVPSLQELRALDSELPALIESPRFLEACARYGMKEADSLRPTSAKPGGTSSSTGIVAEVYMRREKRRLVDLSCVMMERQKMIEEVARAAATANSSTRARPATAAASVETRRNAHAAAVEHARKQGQEAVAGERRRTQSELEAVVQAEARSAARAEHELRRQSELRAAEARQRIEADARRRASAAKSHAACDAIRSRKLAIEESHMEATRDKLQKSFAEHAARLEARKTLVTQAISSRNALAAAQQSERVAVMHMAHEQIEVAVRAKYDAKKAAKPGMTASASMPALTPVRPPSRSLPKRPPTPATAGRVVPIMEGPKGENIRMVRERAAAEQARKAAAFESKQYVDAERQMVNAQIRKLSQALRKEASRQRIEVQQEILKSVHAGDEAFKEATLQRIATHNKHVEGMQVAQEKQIRHRRQLAVVVDAEKSAKAARASRARDYALQLLNEKQDAMMGRVAAAQSQKSSLLGDARKQVDTLHYDRERLKDAMTYAPGLRTLRSEPKLVASLGINLADLEAKSAQAASQAMLEASRGLTPLV